MENLEQKITELLPIVGEFRQKYAEVRAWVSLKMWEMKGEKKVSEMVMQNPKILLEIPEEYFYEMFFHRLLQKDIELYKHFPEKWKHRSSILYSYEILTGTVKKGDLNQF
ncbi:hypothetical protein COB57_01445 [Candidatus Peregrinibacteria bacterium]|nr:MAG: hypothetical protein COB57_01445 [Candidatus Peregrinibacteria bacterium]